jgi:hypothetical protein
MIIDEGMISKLDLKINTKSPDRIYMKGPRSFPGSQRCMCKG